MNKSKNKTQKKTLTRKRARYVGKNKSHKTKVTKKNKSRRGGGFLNRFFPLDKYYYVGGIDLYQKTHVYSEDPKTHVYSEGFKLPFWEYAKTKHSYKELYELLKTVVASLPNNKLSMPENIIWENIAVLIYNWDFYWNQFKYKTDLEKIKFAFPLLILGKCEIFGRGNSLEDSFSFIKSKRFSSNNIKKEKIENKENKVKKILYDNRKKIEEELENLLNSKDEEIFKDLKENYDEIKKAYSELLKLPWLPYEKTEEDIPKEEKVDSIIKQYVDEVLNLLQNEKGEEPPTFQAASEQTRWLPRAARALYRRSAKVGPGSTQNAASGTGEEE